jgi:hypothetical protein
MFKQNKLTQAVAVASLALLPITNANALTFATTGAIATSAEAISGVDYVNSPALTALTAAATAVGSFVTLSFTADFDDDNVFPSTAITCTDATNAMTLQYYSSTANTATYDVKTLAAGTGTAQTCTFPANIMKFAADELVSDAAASANNTGLGIYGQTTTAGGGVIESKAASTAVEVIDVIASELTVTVAGADAVVDVAANRYLFESSGTTDTIAVTITDTGLANGITMATTSSVILKGDFSWMDDTTTTGFQFATGYSVATSDGSAAVTTTCTATQCSYPAASTSTVTYTSTITVPSTGTVVIPTQSFTADTSVVYTNLEPAAAATKTEATTGTAAGSWTMNGTATTVYSMPFGSNVSRFLWVSNSGATDGAVSATVTYDGVTYPATGEYDLGNAAKRTNTKLDALLDAQMTSVSALTPTTGRADVNITVTLPQSATQVYGAYNVGGDRLALETSDTLNANEGMCADLKLINTALDAQADAKADYASVAMKCRD